MSDELKPCPFCGGEARIVEDRYASGVFHVGCGDDLCLGFSGLGWTFASTAAARIAWNVRAAVTDEQFSLAVHDGRLWQKVRTCHMVLVSLYDEEGVDGIECDECGWSDVHEWYDPMPEFCPNCGAKVVG